MAPTLFENAAKPGDLIEIQRDTYQHWAIYIGDNEVVHLIPPNQDLGVLGDLLMLLDSSTAQVRRQKIWDVVSSHSFKVNNFLDGQYPPRDPDIIVSDACKLVGQQLPYSVTSNNCEHFVTELRYGKPESQQVETAAMIGGAAVAGIGLVALGATLFSLFKDNDEDRNKQHRRSHRYRK